MKILLIYPLLSRKRAVMDENKQFWPPLGLAYIASVLEKSGHSVRIIDRDAVLRKNHLDFDRTDEQTIGEIREFGADIVGISATTANMCDVVLISKKIKDAKPDLPVILGGPHATAIPDETLRQISSIDMIVIGEGEDTMREIAAGTPISSVKGLAHRSQGSIIINEPRPQISDLDSLPMPARHLLDMEFYLRPSRFTSRNLSLRTTSIFTARGCPFRCNFCAGPVVFPGKVRYHSAKRVLEEIDHLVEKYNVEALYFAEDMFLADKNRARELLGQFILRPWSRHLKWFAQARTNVIDKDILSLMKQAGCVGIEYGFESGSQRILEAMNKVSKVSDNIRVADMTRQAKMRFQANMIVGYPGETKEDFEETIKFMKRIKPSNIGFNIFMPLPGTAAYRKLKEEGKTIPPWDEIGDQEMSSISYSAMSKEDFERMYIRARFKVILPLNLKNFILDNMHHPARLIYLLFTQFWSIGRKTVRAFFRLKELEKKHAE